MTPDSTAENIKASCACSACHRRKLKCDRNLNGCSTCRNSDIPCVYTTSSDKGSGNASTRAGRREPRGSCNKGKTPRERELEYMVQLLTKRCANLEGNVTKLSLDTTTAMVDPEQGPSSPLTCSPPDQRQSSHAILTSPRSLIRSQDVHPPPFEILELWIIYITSVDIITKVIHTPSVAETVRLVRHCPSASNPSTEALMFSIYIAAINTLDPQETISRFGADKEVLMIRYQLPLYQLLNTADVSGCASLEMLQAAIVLVSCLRRQPGPGVTIPSVFAMGVRLARRLGLDDVGTYATLTPFEAEYSRRAWWTLCRHESAAAEELESRRTSIMHTARIPLPLSFNDDDLESTMMSLPRPRTGLSQMSFVLLSLEVVRMMGELSLRLTQWKVDTAARGKSTSPRAESKDFVEETRRKVEQDILRHCDASRPFDYLILLLAKIILTKTEIALLEPSFTTNCSTSHGFLDVKISLSLDVIECHHLVISEPQLAKYHWAYKNAHQWYATIFVLEEIARRPNASFASRVWRVIDLVFGTPELLNKHGMKPKDRTRLLEAHEKALEARGRLLQVNSSTGITEPVARLGEEQNRGTASAGTMAESEPIFVRLDPWQLNQSLFDVQDAKLNLDAFFWPSSSLEIASSTFGTLQGDV